MSGVDAWGQRADDRVNLLVRAIRHIGRAFFSHCMGSAPTVICLAVATACQPVGSNTTADSGTSVATSRLDPPASSQVPEPPTDTMILSEPDGAVQTSLDSGQHDLSLTPHSAVETTDSGLAPEIVEGDSKVVLDVDAGQRMDASPRGPDADANASHCELVETAECNPVDGCGCATGLNCDYSPSATHLFSCVAPGEIGAQDACDDSGECEFGLVCAQGLCAATCRFDENCAADERCVQVRSGQDVVKGVRVCERECDPLAPNACGDGATCALLGNQAIPTCVRQTGQGSVGDACTTASDCERGLGCAPEGVCRAWCQLDAAAGADGGAGTDAGNSASPPRSDYPPMCPDDTTCELIKPSVGLGLCGAECQKAAIEGSACGRIPATCGCDQGETCQAMPDGRTACGLPGPKGYMAWCDNNSHCAAELSCLGGLCRPSCEPDVLACPDQGVCASVVASKEEPTFACMGRCDPVAPDETNGHFTACGEGAYCSPGVDGSPFPESYCERGNDRAQRRGGPCAWDRDCHNGLGCHINGTCQPWCRDDSDCSPAERCETSLTPRFGHDVQDPIGLCESI